MIYRICIFVKESMPLKFFFRILFPMLAQRAGVLVLSGQYIKQRLYRGGRSISQLQHALQRGHEPRANTGRQLDHQKSIRSEMIDL